MDSLITDPEVQATFLDDKPQEWAAPPAEKGETPDEKGMRIREEQGILNTSVYILREKCKTYGYPAEFINTIFDRFPETEGRLLAQLAIHAVRNGARLDEQTFVVYKKGENVEQKVHKKFGAKQPEPGEAPTELGEPWDVTKEPAPAPAPAPEPAGTRRRPRLQRAEPAAPAPEPEPVKKADPVPEQSGVESEVKQLIVMMLNTNAKIEELLRSVREIIPALTTVVTGVAENAKVQSRVIDNLGELAFMSEEAVAQATATRVLVNAHVQSWLNRIQDGGSYPDVLAYVEQAYKNALDAQGGSPANHPHIPELTTAE
jgi:hypothetical protein